MVDWLGIHPWKLLFARQVEPRNACNDLTWARSNRGRLADVVVVEGDPLSDIKLLQCRDKIKIIMKDGNIYKQTLGE